MSDGLDFNHRNPSERLSALINEALATGQWKRRATHHLGAARLGAACERALQFEYFNTPKEKDFDGPALKRFDAGYAFEDLAAKWLKKAGFELLTKHPHINDKLQFKVIPWHVEGYVDGILTSGPDVIEYPCLWECKALQSKDANKCAKEGLKKHSPLYYAQVQVAMAYCKELDLDLTKHPALFTVVNKDSQALHFEAVPFDPAEAQRISDRAVQLVRACESGELLPRIAQSQDHFECKWCSYSERCWNKCV